MRTVAGLVLLGALVFVTSSCSDKTTPPTPMTFNGSSDKLKATEIVPTLDTPIPPGKNVIWCASFLAAWKTFEQEFTGGPILLEGSPEAANLLNQAADPRPQIPQEALYVAFGSNLTVLTQQIQRDLKRRFPSKEPPTFSGLPNNSLLAYSYIEANVKFPRPYCQNTQPLGFTDGQGKTNQITSFGIRREDSDAQFKLRAQTSVLYRAGDEMMQKDMEFAIDLCSKSAPSQIVVARIPKQRSLSAALARVTEGIAGMEQQARRYGSPKHLHELHSTDILLVPDLCWLLSHHFSELEGKKLKNQRLEGMSLVAAQQDIFFRLNRYGVDLKSESSVASAGMPIEYVLDRPFLIYIKMRGAQMPYFVMWVDNAELLSPWQQTGSSSLTNR